ncbi:MAG: pyrimidine dimer DNA glycosylase/endonuclease V [Candidatus Hadarchaeales archaeon]
MRLWSIHPKYLDRVGLIALWREGLLAQKVLSGHTKGYTNHPQLIRFKKAFDPMLAIGTYLYYVYLEGRDRGYRFNLGKIKVYNISSIDLIPVTSGQIKYEYKLLLHKLSTRDPEWWHRIRGLEDVEPNPVFYIVDGPVAEWEKPKNFLLSDSEDNLQESGSSCIS